MITAYQAREIKLIAKLREAHDALYGAALCVMGYKSASERQAIDNALEIVDGLIAARVPNSPKVKEGHFDEGAEL